MSSRVPLRVLVSVLAGALCGIVVAGAALLLGRPSGPTVALPVPVPVPVARPVAATTPAREVLRAWDAARADAWVAGDAEALGDLYVPGSVAGERDVAMLRAWSRRGARVDGLDTQVLGVEVVVERERRLVLVVTDRVAVLATATTTLQGDRPTTRRVALVRRGDAAWQVASVSPVPARSG